MPEPIDLLHLGFSRVIASYLLDTADGPALIDCGPASTLDALRAGLERRGLGIAGVRHLLLTHVHLDHAGGAGMLARENPGLRVHVSAVGAPHLIDPSRLERSARRLYGEDFDRLWGALVAVPEEVIELAEGRAAGLACLPSPGHASHHVAYLDQDGTLYAGDAAGVRIPPHRLAMPPTPPPDIDVEAWRATLERLAGARPARLALAHFGVVDDVEPHLAELRERLERWAGQVAEGADEQAFIASASAELPDAPAYERAAPLWQCYAGLARWAEKRRSAEPA